MLCRESESSTMDQNVTTLPETVLVTIMEYLSLRDRFNFSLTCKRLSMVFCHPSLWRYLDVIVSGAYCSSRIPIKYHQNPKFDPKILDKYYKIIEKYGRNVQYLKIITLGYFLEFPDLWPQFLVTLAENCRLHLLTVKATIIPNIFKLDQNTLSAVNYLIPVANLVKKAGQLHTFSLLSWPFRMDDPEVTPEVDILRSLLGNDDTKNLRNLKVFWIDEADGWVERNQEFPTPQETVKIVSHFESLTHLSLRLQMLSDELLLEMARSRRSRFQKLEILIIKSDQTLKHQFPVLSSSSWKTFTDHSPDVRVKMLVMNRVKPLDMDIVLLKEIPLETIIFLEHSRIDEEIISTISEKYSDTLVRFESYCESVSCDQVLVNLIENCTNVTNLVFFGQVHHTTVVKLAHLRRRKWWTFKFLESALVTQEKQEDNSDKVVGTQQNGDLFLVSLTEFHEDVDQRKAVLETLKTKVSEIMGYRWSLSTERIWKLGT